jgi:hypothetical protein
MDVAMYLQNALSNEIELGDLLGVGWHGGVIAENLDSSLSACTSPPMIVRNPTQGVDFILQKDRKRLVHRVVREVHRESISDSVSLRGVDQLKAGGPRASISEAASLLLSCSGACVDVRPTLDVFPSDGNLLYLYDPKHNPRPSTKGTFRLKQSGLRSGMLYPVASHAELAIVRTALTDSDTLFRAYMYELVERADKGSEHPAHSANTHSPAQLWTSFVGAPDHHGNRWHVSQDQWDDEINQAVRNASTEVLVREAKRARLLEQACTREFRRRVPTLQSLN